MGGFLLTDLGCLRARAGWGFVFGAKNNSRQYCSCLFLLFFCRVLQIFCRYCRKSAGIAKICRCCKKYAVCCRKSAECFPGVVTERGLPNKSSRRAHNIKIVQMKTIIKKGTNNMVSNYFFALKTNPQPARARRHPRSVKKNPPLFRVFRRVRSQDQASAVASARVQGHL